MLKIRLKRMGAPKKPKYRLVVAEARSPRDGRSLDILGHFDPMTDPETIVVDAERAQGWLQKGAQPTDTAARLLKKAGVTK
jgi:small subunit ribosomal protein S16